MPQPARVNTHHHNEKWESKQQMDCLQYLNDALGAGVDAVWPGCDLWPLTPLDNLRTLVTVTRLPRD